MAVVADANVLVAAANASDSLHSRAARAIAEAAKPIYIPEYAAVEIVTVLSRTIGKDIADSFLRQLIAENDDFEFLASSPALFAAAAHLFISQRTHLSLVDCALLALSSEYEILTFDKALSKAIRAV